MPGRAQIKGPKIAQIMIGMEKAILAGNRETITAASLASKTIHLAELAKASGGDLVLSNTGALTGAGRKGGKVGARYDIKGESMSPESHIKATGPVGLLEYNLRPHLIRSRHLKGTRKQRSAFAYGAATFYGPGKRKKKVGPTQQPVINIPGVGYRRWAMHPGTKGKKPWAKGKKKAQPVITKIMRKRTFNIVKKAAKA